jgi:2,3-bisphosphoglycerate-independent phosphoglycerate mutase
MYRGVSKLVGMDLVGQPESLDEELSLLEKSWADYDFFFLHYKYTDSRGEDGDSDGKRLEIEKFDKVVPRILKLKPDVLIITGDHSTPTQMKSHSWHPVPLLMSAPSLRADSSNKFGETACAAGSLGVIMSTDVMTLAMAHAGKLLKFGA